MATGKQTEEPNNDKSEHSVKEVGSECIKIQANRRPNQGSRQRAKLRGYTRQAAGRGIHHRYVTSTSIAAEHQIRAIKISGGCDYDNSETT